VTCEGISTLSQITVAARRAFPAGQPASTTEAPSGNDPLSRKLFYENLSCDISPLGVLTGTRAIAGAGLALLLAGKVSPEQRIAVGWSLLGSGAVIYVVLIIDLLLQNRGDATSTPP